MKKPFSQTFTLAAGAFQSFVPYRGNGFGIKLSTGTGFTNELQVDFVSAGATQGFSPFPTGFMQTFTKDDGSPDFFDGFVIHNTSSESLTFTVVACNGSTINNNNISFSGDLSVVGAGMVTGQAAISAVVGGVTLAIASGVKATTIMVSNSSAAGLIIQDAAGNPVDELAIGDSRIYPYSNTSIKLVGDGGTATVYAGVIS